MFVQLQKGGVFTDSLFVCSAYACAAAAACCLPGAWRLAGQNVYNSENRGSLDTFFEPRIFMNVL